MSKQSTNIVRICASLILGFTQASFALADTDPSLMNIPPPPTLRGPVAESGPTSAYTTGTSTMGANRGGMSSTAPTAAVARTSSPNASMFNPSSAAATQSANAAAVNAQNKEAARQAAVANPVPATIKWGLQSMPTANTMYSSPLPRR